MEASCARTHPSTGITDESDEEGRELGPTDLRGGVAAHSHEALRACFPHPPHVIGAELKKRWYLPEKQKLLKYEYL